MSDDRLRELERRWRASGADDDEAAYLAERVRAGTLPKQNLHSAAALGYVPARIATGAKAGSAPEGWGFALEEVDHAAVRGGLLILEWMCATSGRHLLPSVVETMRLVVRSWLQTPTPTLAAEANRRSADCEAALIDFSIDPLDRPMCLVAAAVGRTTANREGGLNELRYALAGVRDPQLYIHEILRQGLVPWLLGYGDPLFAQPPSGSA